MHSCANARLHIQQRLAVSVQHMISAEIFFLWNYLEATVTTEIHGIDGLGIDVVCGLFYDVFGFGGAFLNCIIKKSVFLSFTSVTALVFVKLFVNYRRKN